jgi:hypothetical protein
MASRDLTGCWPDEVYVAAFCEGAVESQPVSSPRMEARVGMVLLWGDLGWGPFR